MSAARTICILKLFGHDAQGIGVWTPGNQVSLNTTADPDAVIAWIRMYHDATINRWSLWLGHVINKSGVYRQQIHVAPCKPRYRKPEDMEVDEVGVCLRRGTLAQVLEEAEPYIRML